MKAKKVIVGRWEYSSRSQAALDLLEQRLKGKNHFSKAEIARKVGMTSQTVHAVQRGAGLEIDFSDSPKGRPVSKPATKLPKKANKPSTKKSAKKASAKK